MNTTNQALAYAKNGWHVLPVGPKKAPAEGYGLHSSTIDADEIQRIWRENPSAGVAVACQASGLVVLDCDPRNGGFETLKQLCADDPSFALALASTPQVDTQGGGKHFYFLAEADAAYPSQLGAGLDVKHRGYVVAPPSKGQLGQYLWTPGKDPHEVAVAAAPRQMTVGSRPVARSHANIRAGTVIVPGETYDELGAALLAIPPDIAYENWLKVLYGMSRLHLTDKAYSITREWSIRSNKPGHTPDAFDEKWASVNNEPAHTSYETVFYLADLHDKRWRKNLKPANTDRWREVDLSNLELEPIDYLIDGFLARSLMVLVGKPGMGKSTAMLSLCAAVAGIQIPNSPLLAPAKGRKIIYITEDTDQFKRNLIALHMNCGVHLHELERAIVLLPASRVLAPDLMGLKSKVERHTNFTEQGVMLRPWLVLDTLSASIHLEDENSNAEVSTVLALLKAQFYEELGCSVCLVAHSTKQASRTDFVADPRGAGAWTGDTTLTAGMFEERGQRYIMLGKRRYSPQHTSVRVELLSTPVTVIDNYGRMQDLKLDSALLDWGDSTAFEIFGSQSDRKDQQLDQELLSFLHEESLSGRSYTSNGLNMVRKRIKGAPGKDRISDSIARLTKIGHVKKGVGIVGKSTGWEFFLTDTGIQSLPQPAT